MQQLSAQGINDAHAIIYCLTNKRLTNKRLINNRLIRSTNEARACASADRSSATIGTDVKDTFN